jgi:N-acyl-D-amino-acid deacylase
LASIGLLISPARAATGPEVEELAAFDALMNRLMTEWKIPGGALAVVKDGRLVLARGYGWANREAKRPVKPTSLFRIASLSKQITSVAVLRLAEQKKLSLDDRVFDILTDYAPPKGDKVDPRIKQVTLRQLLHHTGGWDRGASFDPMFIPQRAAKHVGAPAPATPDTIIRFMLGRQLDFDPGTKYAYSNFGYSLLGRVIEKRTGMPYEKATRQLVLSPAGIKTMQLGRTRVKDRAEDEVRYYHHTESERVASVFPYEKEKVAWPDGGFFVEAFDAHGGWIASAVDLARFVTAIDGKHGKRLLSPDSVKQMLAGPKPRVSKNPDVHYGLGWNVRRQGDDANWWHSGSIPGTYTFLVRGHNGLCWAVLFNTRPKELGTLRTALDRGLWQASREVKKWPKHNLFEKM